MSPGIDQAAPRPPPAWKIDSQAWKSIPDHEKSIPEQVNKSPDPLGPSPTLKNVENGRKHRKNEENLGKMLRAVLLN